MKTLTLFRAYELAETYFIDQAFVYGKPERKRRRQLDRFRKALVQRLQEQEEELERLRKLQKVAKRLDVFLPGMLDFLETPFMDQTKIIEDIRHYYKELQEALDNQPEKV